MFKSKKIKRILVVDDQEVARMAISAVMEKHGHVDTAEDGTTALNCYVTALDDGWEYDLICMDITMPGLLSGCQVVRCIRVHEEKTKIGHPVPVVMISATAETAERARDFKLTGADEYIVKPFNQARLDEVIQRFLY